jgi:hypothetical protein
MEKVGVKSVGVPFEECERILAAAKETGKGSIFYKAMTKDRKPVSVTDIHAEGHRGEFSLVLTVEDPEKAERPKKAEPETVESREDEAEGKPEEESERCGDDDDDDDDFGGSVLDMFIDTLGLAIFAAGVLDDGAPQKYCQKKTMDMRDWMLENGLGEMFAKAVAAAFGHFHASFKQAREEEKEDKE